MCELNPFDVIVVCVCVCVSSVLCYNNKIMVMMETDRQVRAALRCVLHIVMRMMGGYVCGDTTPPTRAK